MKHSSSLTPCFLILFSIVVDLVSQTALAASLQKPSTVAVEEDTRPECFENEPCQYVIALRKSTSNMFHYKKIDTWCRCKSDQRCRAKRFDKRRKASIHVCKPKTHKKNNKKSHVSRLFHH